MTITMIMFLSLSLSLSLSLLLLLLPHMQTRKDGCRPDKDVRRNCLTSIYWVPTNESPILKLARNVSDHVHYYQGGKPFEYTIYDPSTKNVSKYVLGPDITNGQLLQVPVPGGLWKCGRLLTDELPSIEADYCIIAEAVGPGFDVNDFHFLNSKDLEEHQVDKETIAMLQPYLNVETASSRRSSLEKEMVDLKDKVFDKHYD